ncbi:hypothetical protein Vadar_030813 [Vaccinium darrowii]|uniref:Uncharacterized protein n=1 Tax=Vaccinium darrowii TaxID=229202 RepID=A0ACB7XV80_9ERIC|nr:hypothetical protein Vadar_030813 [Vaccinium darrowii]
MGRSKRKANQNTATISDLPNHIICDILSRLPLSSIFTCKRVCKIWHNLILEPCFAKLHLSRSPLSLVFYRPGNSNDSPSYFEILQLHDPPDLDQHNATMKFTTQIYLPHRHVEMLGSCNGSILLANYVSDYKDLVIIVCNPLRARHHVLPEPSKLALRTHGYAGLGFVHSPSTDKHKVLLFTHTWTNLGPAAPAWSRDKLYCDTFTIGIDDEWRSIGDTGMPPDEFALPFVFLNGAIHWIGFENSRVICYFDIEKEQFGSFPLPSHFGLKGQGRFFLGVIDNWLYIQHDSPYMVWKFWVMKDYGDFGSWTPEWVIERPITSKFASRVKLLKMLNDGTLLMFLFKSSMVPNNLRGGKITKTLASYNPQTRVLSVLKTTENICILPAGHSFYDAPRFFSPMDALK